MTLKFCDSFAHYSFAQITRKYESTTLGSIVAGPWGGASAGYQVAAGGADHAHKTVPAVATYVLGVRYKPSEIRGNGAILSVWDTGTLQVSLRMLGDGRLAAWRAGTLLGSGTKALLTGVWYYLELKVTVDPAVGVVVLKIDGATDINLSAQNTRNTAASQITQAGVGWDTATGCCGGVFSDLYILDTAGARNNDFLGDTRVEAIYPTGAGNYGEFTTLVGAATHWQATSDNPADDDTSYVGSATVNQRDTYATGNLSSASGTVAGVVVNHESRKDDAGARTVAGMCRNAATDLAGAGAAVSAAFAIFQEIFETDPAAAAWTIANVNSAEFGVKELA